MSDVINPNAVMEVNKNFHSYQYRTLLEKMFFQRITTDDFCSQEQSERENEVDMFILLRELFSGRKSESLLQVE
jgi:hypothetical protein